MAGPPRQPATEPAQVNDEGDFTRIAESMRESGEELVKKIGITHGLKVLDLIELAAPNATEDQLREIVRRAEAHSPVRDAIAREVSMTTEVVTS